MEASEFLLTMAEVSLALITFAALVLVLRQLVGGELAAFHLLILRMFALCGFATLFFSLLPFLLRFLGLSTDAIWQASSGFLGLGIVATFTWYYRQRRKVAPGRGAGIALVIVSVVMALIVPTLLLHSLGLIYAGSIGPYAVGLVSALVPVATAFFSSIEDFMSTRS